MNALEANRYSEAWRRFGESVPRPRAIVVVSAHWVAPFTAVTAMPAPRTIHDFFGFPEPLFEVQYPAPGDPELAAELVELVRPTRVGLDRDMWGIDHGSWSVLVHAFPQADIPVLQLTIDSRRDFSEHLELAARLAPLRERGVLIVGSGNVVHNLRALRWGEPELGFDWAKRFNEATRTMLFERPGDVPSLIEHPDYARAVPTTEHFIPLLYLAGLAAGSGSKPEVLVEGYAMGSLSMDSYMIDAHCPTDESSEQPSAPLPHPSILPPEETNV